MFNKRGLLEYFLIPLLVSFFMSGINATLELKTEKNIEFEILFYEWISNWFIAYTCTILKKDSLISNTSNEVECYSTPTALPNGTSLFP